MSNDHEGGYNPNSIDATLSRMNSQLTAMESHMTALVDQVRRRCDSLEARLETLETQRAWVVGVTVGISTVMGFGWVLAKKLLNL